MTNLSERVIALSGQRFPGEWKVDPRAISIFTDHLDGGKVFDIRGWGHLTGAGAMRLEDSAAEAIQRSNAELVCLLMNNLDEIAAALLAREASDGDL